MGAMASKITSLTIVYSTVYSGADQRKHQSSASLAIVWGIHRWPVNSPQKGPVTWKMFPFDDVIIIFADVADITAVRDISSFPSGHIWCHFADDIFRCVFVNVKFCVLIQISLKCILKGPIDNNPTLVWIMAWRRIGIGDKPLSEPMLTRFIDTNMRH